MPLKQKEQAQTLNHVLEEMTMLKETMRVNELMKDRIKYDNPENFEEARANKI